MKRKQIQIDVEKMKAQFLTEGRIEEGIESIKRRFTTSELDALFWIIWNAEPMKEMRARVK